MLNVLAVVNARLHQLCITVGILCMAAAIVLAPSGVGAEDPGEIGIRTECPGYCDIGCGGSMEGNGLTCPYWNNECWGQNGADPHCKHTLGCLCKVKFFSAYCFCHQTKDPS